MNARFVVSIVVLVVLIIAFLIFGNRGPSSYIVEEPETEEVDWDWIRGNCDCVERGNLYCKFKGYELKEGMCWSGSNFTNPVRGCSMYNCTGEIYIYEGN